MKKKNGGKKKTKTTKALSLVRTTIRDVSGGDLGNVAGGRPPAPYTTTTRL
jgi:hypothetical protein